MQAQVELEDGTRPASGFGAIANHSAEEEMLAFNDWAKIPANSTLRLERARRWCGDEQGREPKREAEAMKRPLSSTAEGVRSELDPGFRTVWSWVAELGGRRIDLCDRLPEPDAYRACEF